MLSDIDRLHRFYQAVTRDIGADPDIGQKAAATLARAGVQAPALLAAMDLIATHLLQDQTEIAEADPDSPGALACLRAYYDLLSATIPGLPAEKLPLPLPDAAAYRPPQGLFLLATCAGLPVGCVSLRPLEPGVAEVKRLWVHPDARGQGLARRLMTALEDRARDIDLRRLKLDSNSSLTGAITLYRRMGWTDCAPYTGHPADVWMEKTLSGRPD